MRRREALGAAAGLLSLPVLGRRDRVADPYEPLGRIGIEGAKEAVVAPDGSVAYVAATDGFATVDLADPASPTVLAERRNLLADRFDGPLRGIQDVTLDGDRLVVAGPAHPRPDAVKGFLLYDVADPAAPRRVAFHETEFPIHNAVARGGRAYLTARNSIVIVDLADDDPAVAGRWSLADGDSRWRSVDRGLWAPHDVWVCDGRAYVPCWEAGTWIVDVSEPGAPRTVAGIGGRPPGELARLSRSEAGRARTEPPGNHHYARTADDGPLLAVGKESWDAESGDGIGGPSGIELWDVADPAAPVGLAEIRPPRAGDETFRGTWTTAHNFDIVDGRLFASWYQGGVTIVDVSDPASPRELAWWRDPGTASFWTAQYARPSFFVASSVDQPRPTVTAGLFTFPNEPGRQRDPPALAATSPQSPSPTASRSTTGGSSPASQRTVSPPRYPTMPDISSRRGSSDSTTASGAPDRSTSTPSTGATTATGAPGFGALAAAAGASIAAWLEWRRRSGDGD